MRNNLPVTNTEVQLRDDIMIVSTTDLKGQITYVNKDFLEVSGFTEAELMGEPHNIVRHPDMPVEAFEDLWKTLKAGRPWTGFVKNRCKNGDYYWVEANATPMWQGTEVVGYMSLRRKPSRAAVEAHEAAYRLFREGKAKGLAIENGMAVSTAPLGRIQRLFANMALSKKMILACAVMFFLVMASLTLVLGNYMAAELEQDGLQGLSDKLHSIRAMVEVRAKALNKETARLNDVFSSYFVEAYSLEGDSESPVLKNGSIAINQRTVEVDRFTSVTGAVATVFARKGDDLVRVSTSVKKENGERAVGTPLSKEHPGYTKLMAGERYVGKAKLFSKDYYTSYTPIKDKEGKVIGATFIGLDISPEITALKEHIRAVKAGSTGYFYVIDSTPGKDAGTLIVHPAKEGANIYTSKDADGNEFIREMIEKKQGTIRYPWLNKELGDTTARIKVVVYENFGEWNWLIGGGTYTDEFERLARNLKYSLAGASLFIVLILTFLIYWLVRSIVNKPLITVLDSFRTISGGDYTTRIPIAKNDEIGRVFQGLQAMQTRMGFEVAESKRRADETLRIKIALDNVSTGVMIADTDRNIIYTNKAVEKMLKIAESDIRAQLPDFSADKLIGTNIDTFHKNPAHQANLLKTFTSTYIANMTIGVRHMRVTASPVINEQNVRLGAVAEWLDRTGEVSIEHEVARIVEGAKRGDFEQRLSLEGKEGFFKQLAEGLNNLAEVTSNGLQDVARV
ncbi:MAG: Cache 3/Cache 2 fusion domain-containing protein, partial [Betaproteobacteria bacterium]|nr:Cache 3/Cache 2 fusion domain-containing protein [Betaproteobacteria bacterium]